MNEQLAIIEDVGFGCRDVGRPCLWFTVRMLGGLCALQVLYGDTALKVIEESGCYDVRDLEGRGCRVESDGRGGGACLFIALEPSGRNTDGPRHSR